MIHLLLTSPRTGSTWYSGHLAKQYMCKELGEYFHQSVSDTHEDRLAYISLNTNTFLVKLFYSQAVDSPVEHLLDKCINIAKTKTILLRRDIDAQIQSLYVAAQYERYKNPDSETKVTYQTHFSEPFRVTYDHDLFSSLKERTETDILELAKIYQAGLGFNLVFLEDIKDTAITLVRPGKLYRPTVWDFEPEKTQLKITDLFT